MLNRFKLRVDKIERSEVSGVLSISFLDDEGFLSVRGEFPLRFIKGKLNEGDYVYFVFSSDEINLNDIKVLGEPLIIFEALVFKKSKSEEAFRYYLSCYGLQFRLRSRDDVLEDADKLNIAVVRVK